MNWYNLVLYVILIREKLSSLKKLRKEKSLRKGGKLEDVSTIG